MIQYPLILYHQFYYGSVILIHTIKEWFQKKSLNTIYSCEMRFVLFFLHGCRTDSLSHEYGFSLLVNFRWKFNPWNQEKDSTEFTKSLRRVREIFTKTFLNLNSCHIIIIFWNLKNNDVFDILEQTRRHLIDSTILIIICSLYILITFLIISFD